MFRPTAYPVCLSTGGPFSGCGGAPPAGHHVSASCTCPAEEVCHINELKQVSRRSFSPDVHIGGQDCYFVVLILTFKIILNKC